MKERLVLFYQKDFARIQQLHPRDKVESIALLLIKEVQLAAILLSDAKSNSFLKTVYQVIDFAKIYPIVCWEKQNNCQLLYFPIFVLTIFVIALILLYLFIFHRGLFFGVQQEINSNEEQLQSKSKSLQQIPLAKYRQSQDESSAQGEQSYFYFSLQKLFATFIQTYQYILFQPCFYLFTQNLIQGINEQGSGVDGIGIFNIIVGIIMIPLFVLLYMFMDLHKISYRFNDPDTMGVYANKYNIYLSVINFALIVVKIITETQGAVIATIILACAYYGFSYWIGSTYHQKLNFQIQLFRNQLDGQIGLIFLLLFVQEMKSIGDIDLLFYYLFYGPILFLITNQVFNRIERDIILFHKNQIWEGVYLDWQLRFIYAHSQSIFLKKRENFNQTKRKIISSLLLYNILSNHLYQCNGFSQLSGRASSCFCLQYFPEANNQNQKATWDKYVKKQTSEDGESEVIEQVKLTEKEFQHFIFDYIKCEYEFFLKKRKKYSLEISLSYIYFILEALKIPTKAFYETLNLNRIMEMDSIKNKQLIFQLHMTSKIHFNELVIRKNLKNQKYNHQACFLLDKSMNIVMQNIITTVTQLKSWLELIIYQKAENQLLFEEGQLIVANINEIEIQLNKMFVVNPLSVEIEQFYSFYFKHLNFHQKRNPAFKKNSKMANEFVKSYNRVAFNKDSCVVGISFLNPIGRIVRYTNNFLLFIGVNDKRELNSCNINRFIPEILSKNHDQYLLNFIELGRMNIVKSEQRFILIKTSEGFVTPIIAKIKVEDTYDDDFGASAILIKVSTPYHYLLLNRYCLLEEISKNIFQIFKQILKCSISQMKGIDLLLMIPELLAHWQQHQVEDDIEDESEKQNLSQSLNQQIEFDLSLILPKNHDLKDSLLLKKSVIKKSVGRYLKQNINNMQAYFRKLEDFDLFHLRVKIIPVVTKYENVYILEIRSIKQFKKLQLEEKIDRMKAILNQVFPFQVKTNEERTSTSIPWQEEKQLDIANLEELIIKEDDQMGDILSQNLSKIIHTNTASNQMKQSTLNNNSRGQIGTLGQVSTPELPTFKVVQTHNYLTQRQIENSESDYFTDNDSSVNDENNNEKENIDQNSISSAARYSDQFAKRRLIHQVIFEKSGQRNKFWRTLFHFEFLGLFILSSIIFYLLVKLDINSNNRSNLKSIGGFNQLFNQYFMYKDCKQEVIDCEIQYNKTLLEFSTSVANLTNFFQEDIQFTTCIQQKSETPTLEYELSFVFEMMHQEKDEYLTFLAENYYCFIEIFHAIDKELQLHFTQSIVYDKSDLEVCFMVGLIFILIFSFLLLPFELYQNKQKNQIMDLFQTLNKSHLIGQFQNLYLISESNQKSDLISKEFIFEEVLDSSKSKYDSVETKNFVKNTSVNKKLGSFGNITFSSFKKSIKDIPLKILAIFSLMFLLQSYFSLSYFLFNSTVNDIEHNISEGSFILDFSSTFLQMCGEMRIVTSEKFYSNQTMIDIFSNKMSISPLNNNLTQIWQSQIKILSDENNLTIFCTTDICEIFQQPKYQMSYFSYLDSDFSFSICNGIVQLQQGFVLIMWQISNFYDEIVNILNFYQQKVKLYSDEVQEAYFKYQLNSLFAIKAIDEIKAILINYQSSIQLYLLIILFIIYIFILGWIYIYGLFYLRVYILQSLEKAKRLLSLIPMDTLLENAHVQSFVQREQKKKKTQ